MATENITFNDIRIVICSQGYQLDCEYLFREIGFCCNGLSSSIPFNCRINKSTIDLKNQLIIKYCENEIHGIPIVSKYENSLTMSEIKPVLKTLYNLSENGKYIGINSDENLKGMLYKCGLGSVTVDLDTLQEFKKTNNKCPRDDDLQFIMKQDVNRFNICNLHNRLQSQNFPICVKVKAEFLYEYCKTYIIPE